MAKEIDLGAATAYALAVKQGYDGTLDEWLASLVGPQGASITGVKLNEESHLIVTVENPGGGSTEIDAGAVDTSEAVNAAKQEIEKAGDSEAEAIQSAGSSQVEAVNTAGDTQTKAVQSAGAEQVSAVDAAGTAQIKAVQSAAREAQETAVSAVEDAGAKQQSAVAGVGTQALEAIGQTEQAVINQVKSAGTAQVETVQQAGNTAVSSVNEAADAKKSELEAVASHPPQPNTATGKWQVWDAETGAYADTDALYQGGYYTPSVSDDGVLTWQGSQDGMPTLPSADIRGPKGEDGLGLPTPTEGDAGKVPTVNDAGTGYVLGEAQVDAYTKAESDARYAPIAAAIRPTVSGNPATLEHSVAWAMQGLKIYGKSTQDGTPSPDSPVPIVTAGSDGSIDITVSDGADQSQKLVISTPNGLPGIPVVSGGNYTDASGQQWVCDEVDFARGVYVQRIGKLVVDGTELYFSTSPGSHFWNLPNNSAPYSAESNTATITTHFPNGVFFFNGTFDFMYTMRDKMSRYFETVDAINQFCVEENSKGNPLTVYYVYEVPQETPLSAEELAAYAALRSYNGTTVVATDAPVAGLSARYVADGAAYIDGKIQSAVTEAVTQAVALTGGNA